jgi:hypothetical protein
VDSQSAFTASVEKSVSARGAVYDVADDREQELGAERWQALGPGEHVLERGAIRRRLCRRQVAPLDRRRQTRPDECCRRGARSGLRGGDGEQRHESCEGCGEGEAHTTEACPG